MFTPLQCFGRIVAKTRSANPTAQATPISPNAKKATRQPARSMKNAAAAGAATVPDLREREHRPLYPAPFADGEPPRHHLCGVWERARLRRRAKEEPHEQPSVRSPVATPVSAVKADHASTILVRTLCGPLRYPSRPTGTAQTP